MSERARAINLTAQLKALKGLTGRTPETHGDALWPCFGPTHPYRDGFISTVKFSGTSAWERHGAEEILLIAEGFGFLHTIDADGFAVPRTLSTNMLVVVPANCWHQIESPGGISMITVTPQPTDHQAERP